MAGTELGPAPLTFQRASSSPHTKNLTPAFCAPIPLEARTEREGTSQDMGWGWHRRFPTSKAGTRYKYRTQRHTHQFTPWPVEDFKRTALYPQRICCLKLALHLRGLSCCLRPTLLLEPRITKVTPRASWLPSCVSYRDITSSRDLDLCRSMPSPPKWCLPSSGPWFVVVEILYLPNPKNCE